MKERVSVYVLLRQKTAKKMQKMDLHHILESNCFDVRVACKH